MPRQKKERFEYVPKLKLYRKRIKDVDGKYVPIYGKTEAELAAKLEEARAVIAAGLDAKENPTVESYAESWLPAVTAEMGDKYKESFEGALRRHVLPVIGGLHMREVLPDDAQSVMTRLAGKSSSLQGKVLNAMRRMFDNAVRNRLITGNPCENLKAGGKKAKKKKALTEDQAKTLLQAVAGTRAETFVYLGLYAGLRREESLGLRWEHVHLDDKDPYLEVCLNVIYPNNSKAMVKDVLKSDAANRIIPLSEELNAYLRSLQPASGFVVNNSETPLSYSQYSNLWAIVERRSVGEGFYWDMVDGKAVRKTFEKKLGEKSKGGDYCYTIDFEVTSHILRHTCASNWIKSGVDVRTVQYMLGHADPKLTLEIYSHIIEESPAALAESIRNPKVLKVQNSG